MMSITQPGFSVNPAQEQYWKEHIAKQKESGLSEQSIVVSIN